MKTLLLTFVILILICSNSYTQWSTNPYENLQVAEHGGNIHIASDGNGGAIVTFNNFADVVNGYLQLINKYGYFKWNEPKVILDGPGQRNYVQDIFYNADGTILIGYTSGYTYIDSNLTQYSFFDPYIQKIDTNGIRLWGEDGIKLNPYSSSQRVSMFLCNDDEDGLYAFWVISPNEYPEYDSLFIQHISKNGERLWGENGIFIDDSIFSTLNSWIIEAEGGDIYIQYRKKNTEHYIRKYDPSGNLVWTLINSLSFPMVINDDQGGIVVNGVKVVSPRQLIINRISTVGEKLWGEEGIIVDSVGANYADALMLLNSDSTVSVFWDTEWWPNDDLFLQLYTLEGTQIWNEHLKISETISPKVDDGIIQSDNNSNYIIWRERRDSAGVYAQKIDASGNKLLNEDVLLQVMTYGTGYDEFNEITDGNAGAIIVWRTDPPWGGIYAQQISKYGNLGEVITTVIGENNNIDAGSFYLAQNYPNPFNPLTIIKYDLPFASEVSVVIYDILGRKVKELVNTKQQAGRYEIQFDATNFASGVYIYQLISEKYINSKKMILLK